MNDPNYIVSKVGQQLIEYVMTEVVREFDPSSTKGDYLSAVLQMAYESAALALGWLHVSTCVGGFAEDERRAAFVQKHRLGQALAIDKFQAQDDPRVKALAETLAVELTALRNAREKEQEKGPLN